MYATIAFLTAGSARLLRASSAEAMITLFWVSEVAISSLIICTNLSLEIFTIPTPLLFLYK
jgi:hypothetical protein